jgi:hypothetical protein
MPDPIYARIVAASDAAGLLVMGALHPARVGAKGDLAGTLILLGAGPGFWPAFTASPEATDDRPDPVDRWSTRVVEDLAKGYRASALFPFGGPPYQPFLDWAVKSGRAWQSPVGMLVHDTVGLMISFRGALHLDAEIAIPNAVADAPCRTCIGQPCAPDDRPQSRDRGLRAPDPGQAGHASPLSGLPDRGNAGGRFRPEGLVGPGLAQRPGTRLRCATRTGLSDSSAADRAGPQWGRGASGTR